MSSPDLQEVCHWKTSLHCRQMGSIDTSTPSKKSIRLVQNLSRKQALIIMQLQTGHIGLNKYLHHIKHLDTPNVPITMHIQMRLSTISCLNVKDPPSIINFAIDPLIYPFYYHIYQPLFPCWNTSMLLVIWSKPSGQFAQITRPQHKTHNAECLLIRANSGTMVLIFIPSLTLSHI